MTSLVEAICVWFDTDNMWVALPDRRLGVPPVTRLRLSQMKGRRELGADPSLEV